MARKELKRQKESRRRSDDRPAEEGEATEVSEARSLSWRRGKKTPTPGELRRTGNGAQANQGTMAVHVQLRSAEAFSGVVKHPVPRSTARSPRLRGVSTR